MPTANFATVFHEIAALLAIATVCGVAALPLRQPLVVAFLAAGVLAGPAGLGWVSARQEIALLSELGISLLLFLVGLKLDLKVIRTLGPVALATGLGQVIFTSVAGYGICLALGMGHLPSLYVSVAATFSSTIIIVKLLTDKRELDSLHGRIAVGFLIVQDLVAVLAIIALASLGGSGEGAGAVLTRLALHGGALLLLLAVATRWILPGLVAYTARSGELLVLFGITLAVVCAAIAEEAGFSAEVGAFLAGMGLAATPYRDGLGSRLTGLRDFMLLFFFLDLGSTLNLGEVTAQVGPGMILSVFVLVGNPLIVMAIMGAMGYRKRTGFMAGLAVAQISEFSLILGSMGVAKGHITSRELSLLTLVGLVTISLSSYMILYSGRLYAMLEPWLGPFERADPHREPVPDRATWEELVPEVLVVGLGGYGLRLAQAIQARGKRVVGIDFDPLAVERAEDAGIVAFHGDVEDPHLLGELPLRSLELAVCGIPGVPRNLRTMEACREAGIAARVVLTARSRDDAGVLADVGAGGLLHPYEDATARAVNLLLGPAADDAAGTPVLTAEPPEEGPAPAP